MRSFKRRRGALASPASGAACRTAPRGAAVQRLDSSSSAPMLAQREPSSGRSFRGGAHPSQDGARSALTPDLGRCAKSQLRSEAPAGDRCPYLRAIGRMAGVTTRRVTALQPQCAADPRRRLRSPLAFVCPFAMAGSLWRDRDGRQPLRKSSITLAKALRRLAGSASGAKRSTALPCLSVLSVAARLPALEMMI